MISKFDIAMAIAAFALMAAAMFSPYIKNRLYLSEPVIFMLLGIAVGPLAGKLLTVHDLSDDPNRLLEDVARVTLAISVVGAAMRLPPRYLARHWGELSAVLTFGMLLMWGLSSLFAYFLLSLSPLMALLIGAIITATDPVLAATIVVGPLADKCIPARLRHLLSAESGANDGLALILVMIPIYLMTYPPGEALQHWLWHTLLYEIILAVVVGAAIGTLAGLGLAWVRRGPYSAETSLLTITLGLTLTVLILLRGLDSDGILGTFVAGAVFNRFFLKDDGLEERKMHEAIGRVFELPMFTLFGLALPWSSWETLGWTAVAFAVAALVLRRIPVWLLIGPFLPSLHRYRDALFTGWFGPMGISALFYAAFATDRLHSAQLWPVVSLVVFIAAMVHGVTSTPLTKWLGPKIS